MKKLAILALIGLSGCTSVGVRTVGHQPVTIIIGQPAATPSPVPVEVKK